MKFVFFLYISAASKSATTTSKSTTSTSSRDPWHVDLSDSDSDDVKVVSSPAKGCFFMPTDLIYYLKHVLNLPRCSVGSGIVAGDNSDFP